MCDVDPGLFKRSDLRIVRGGRDMVLESTLLNIALFSSWKSSSLDHQFAGNTDSLETLISVDSVSWVGSPVGSLSPKLVFSSRPHLSLDFFPDLSGR